MNQRFLILTFAAFSVTFAAVWAATAPIPHRAAAQAGDAPPAVMYADCDAVRAAHAAPLRASQPGYRPALDPNMNGIACETVGAPDPVPMTSAPAQPDPGVVPDASPPPPPPPVEQPNPMPAGAGEEKLPALT